MALSFEINLNKTLLLKRLLDKKILRRGHFRPMAGDLVQSWDEDRILNSDSHAQENVWKRSNQVLKLSLSSPKWYILPLLKSSTSFWWVFWPGIEEYWLWDQYFRAWFDILTVPSFFQKGLQHVPLNIHSSPSELTNNPAGDGPWGDVDSLLHERSQREPEAVDHAEVVAHLLAKA